MINNRTDFSQIQNNFETFSDVESHCVYGDYNLLKKVNVTIAIPTYRRSSLLKEALLSAISQVGYNNYCIIVVDNDSEENTETQKMIYNLNDDKIIYFRNRENIGMFGNQNRCFEIPQSEWVLLLHDDDILMPHYLCECMNVLNQREDIDALQPKRLYLEKNKIYKIGRVGKNRLERVYDLSNYLVFKPGTQSGGIFKKRILMELGGYNPDFYPTSDFCLGVLMARNFRFYIFNKYLSIYRYENNASLNNEVINQTIYNDYFLKRWIMKNYCIPNFMIDCLTHYIANRIIQKSEKNNLNYFFDKNIKFKRITTLSFYIMRFLMVCRFPSMCR